MGRGGAGAFDVDSLLRVYQWKLVENVVSLASSLISIANKHTTAAGEFMSLHSTSYVCLGPDRLYEEVWFEQAMESEKLKFGHVYWTETAAVASVSLSPPYEKLFHELTLCLNGKPSHWEWQYLWLWLQFCLGLADFHSSCRNSYDRE